MSADTDTPTEWYRPPDQPQPANWPSTEPLGNRELAPFPANWAAEEDAPTIYRSDTLDAPAALDDAVLDRFNAALADRGWTLTRGPAYRDRVRLELTAADDGTPDSFEARERLRATPGLPAAAVADLGLQRLYFVGMPAKEGHGLAGRSAVDVVAVPPTRAPADRVPGGRRPVVAVIDSGVATHPWLDATGSGPFWSDAEAAGWVPSVPLGPATDRGTGDRNPVDGMLDTHAGHGTFITGLVRQLAPDAEVLSLHVMRGDGVLDEELVLDALGWLLDRVRGAAADPAAFVDVVSLSFGYYEQHPGDQAHTVRLRRLLGELGDLGVRVVASAGNNGNESPVYPAAFADPAWTGAPRTPLVSVGALNPNGSRAEYSNFGSWVVAWMPGTTMISATPAFGEPGDRTLPQPYDPDDLNAGFASWSGTSFATAILAGRLARALSDGAAGTAELADVSPAAAHRRAALAYEAATKT